MLFCVQLSYIPLYDFEIYLVQVRGPRAKKSPFGRQVDPLVARQGNIASNLHLRKEISLNRDGCKMGTDVKATVIPF